ncbi:DUF3833 domain-containing protein [Roseovarius nitratireducens]|uniref:DUF3833 domain-containing protein n=1 Tax=Roseovarius nitratireducens TaxID=2044597 RepID=UPI000CE188B7|nr:DUF3833 domain-containing protein [Roseovarius nitratireducens]
MDAVGLILLGALGMLAFMAVAARVAGFGAQRLDDYAASTPRLDLREHLNGPIKCEGVIYGPLGRVASRFDADFEAEWRGGRGIMREHFRYDSGNRQDREWRLTLSNDGTIRAEADDLVGPGHGQQTGAAARLSYRIRLPREAGGHVLSVTDWMYLTPGGVIVNRSQFRKFGIKVAELVATMRRVEP